MFYLLILNLFHLFKNAYFVQQQLDLTKFSGDLFEPVEIFSIVVSMGFPATDGARMGYPSLNNSSFFKLPSRILRNKAGWRPLILISAWWQKRSFQFARLHNNGLNAERTNPDPSHLDKTFVLCFFILSFLKWPFYRFYTKRPPEKKYEFISYWILRICIFEDPDPRRKMWIRTPGFNNT